MLFIHGRIDSQIDPLFVARKSQPVVIVAVYFHSSSGSSRGNTIFCMNGPPEKVQQVVHTYNNCYRTWELPIAKQLQVFRFDSYKTIMDAVLLLHAKTLGV